MMDQKQWKKLYTFGFPIIVLAVFIAANLISAHLDRRFSLSPDLSGGLYTIGEETEHMLAALSREVTIIALDEETAFKTGSRTGMVNELLTEYQHGAAGRLTVKYVKTSTNPGLLANYQGNIQSGGLIVTCGERYEVLTLDEMFVSEINYQTMSYQTTAFVGERQLTNAIARVAVAEQEQIYLITGHGETYGDAVTSRLVEAGYAVSQLNLTVDEIPETASLLIINEPQVDFSASELTRLEQYQNDFGNAMILLGAGQDNLANLNLYLAEWGVAFEKNIIVDQDRSIGSVIQISPLLVIDESNETLSQQKDRFLLTPGARSITLLWEDKGSRSLRPVLQTGGSAYAKSYDNPSGLVSTVEQEAGDVAGPFYVGVMAEVYDLQGTTIYQGRTLFLSAPAMFQEELLEMGNLLNGEYLTEMAAYLTQSQAVIYSIPAKSAESSGMAVVGINRNMLLFATVLLPGLLTATAGLAVWGRRRRL